MKRTNVKFLLTVILAILLLVTLQSTSKAVASFSATGPSNTTVTVGDTIPITVTATGAAGMYKVSASNSNVSLASGSEEEFLENSSATVTYKAEKAGTVTITATATTMADLEDSTQKVTGSNTFTITVKEKETPATNTTNEQNTTTEENTNTNANTNTNTNTSSGNTNTSSSTNTNSGGVTVTEYNPTFTDVNETVYATSDVNVRENYSTSSTRLGTLSKGDSIARTGKSTDGVWSKVTYQGKTAYIASSYLSTTRPEPAKSSNKNLTSLTIKDVELTPAFEKGTTQYTATVLNEITKLEIDAKAEDSKATVEIVDNNELKVGDNIIKIRVTAEDNTVRTYMLTVTREEKNETADKNELKLASLSIKNVNFEEKFNPSVYHYELTLSANVTNLEMTAMPNQEDAKVEITGNENFKIGQNIVKIILTSADNTKTTTYEIKVVLPEDTKEMQEASETAKTALYAIAGVVIAAIVIIFGLSIVNRGKRQEREDDEEDILEQEEEEKVDIPDIFGGPKRSKGKHSK